MRPTSLFAVAAMLLSVPAFADTDPACLQHLGGAFAGVECYNGLANDLRKTNASLTSSLLKLIPEGNKNKRRLAQYLKAIDNAAGSCDVASASDNGWQPAEHTGNPRYLDSDVLLYDCRYRLLKAENEFLQSLIANSKP